jgi:uncharacterized protein (TIGR03437 family)
LLHAAGLTLSATTASTITCNTATGPATPVTINVKPGTDVTYPVVLSLGTLPAGLVVTAATSNTLTSANAATGLNYVFSAAPGCAGLTAGANTASTFHFLVAQNGGQAAADTNNVTTTITVTATSSPLSISANSATISCVYNAGNYTPSPSTLTLTVTSAATGGTSFSLGSKPSWLTMTSSPPYDANPSATVTFTPACSGSVGSVTSGAVSFTNAPAPAASMTITMKVVSPATLTALTPATQTYTTGSGSSYYPTWTVTLSGATNGQVYGVSPTSLGSWLSASPLSGTFNSLGSNTIVFQATGGIDSLTAQSTPYSQTVHIQISGYADTTVAISLLVKSPAATLSFAEGNVRNLTWVQGQGLPTATITAVSSGSPIQFSTTASGAIAPIISTSEQSGLAYNFGTEIPVSFPNLPFSEAQPGSVLTGAVKFAWGSNTSTVTFNVTVQAGVSTAVLTSTVPSNLPTASVGQQFTLTLYGSGFVPSADPTQKTTVGIVSGGLIVSDANILTATVSNTSTIVLIIQAPTASSDPLLPWTGTSVSFGVCNPAGGVCTTPTGTVSLPIGAGPTISNIVSASTLTSATPPNVAPYDILTLWGTNFCTSDGTGCGANGILYGQLNPSTLIYSTSLSPDGGQRNLQVKFGLHGAMASTFVAAPLLFATNNQINLVVPATNFPAAASTVDVVVSFGGLSSNTFEVTSVVTDPGIFMTDTYGQAAVLNSNYALAAGPTPATIGTILQIYATGLGTPTSLTGASPVVWSSMTCMTPANYETAAGSTSVDGALIQSALLGADLPPCFGTGAPSSIKVGGQTATIGYSGWVADSVAGLYQVNATPPASPSSPAYFVDAAGSHLSSITSPVQLPVVLTSNSVMTQQPGSDLGISPGATVWVQPPSLSITTPGTLSVTSAGGSWTSTMTASGGTAPYSFKVDGLASPATGGLTYTVSSPTLSFVLAPATTGVYIITVTATDANGVTGSNTFTLTVTDSSDTSTVTASATPIVASTYGTANPAVTTITAGGGTGPYTYAITPAALSISSTGVVSIGATAQAGSYHADVTITDSASNTRDIYFDVPVAMAVTATNNLTTLTGIANLTSPQTLTTIGNLGGGTVSYALVQPDSAKCTFTLTSGVLGVPSSGCVAGTYSVSVIGTDSAPPTSASAAKAVLNLSIHLN